MEGFRLLFRKRGEQPYLLEEVDLDSNRTCRICAFIRPKCAKLLPPFGSALRVCQKCIVTNIEREFYDPLKTGNVAGLMCGYRSFKQIRTPRTTFMIGRLIREKGYIGGDGNLALLCAFPDVNDYELREYRKFAQVYMSACSGARKAIHLLRHLLPYKDVRLIIAKMVWEDRDMWSTVI